jgi:hypothetical protein
MKVNYALGLEQVAVTYPTKSNNRIVVLLDIQEGYYDGESNTNTGI